MEKKRSIGVTIFGVLTIGVALLALPYLFNAKSAIEPFLKPYGVILYVLSFPLLVLEIVLGVNILKLKEWARRGLVILTLIYIATLFVIPHLEDKNYEQCKLQYLGGVLQPQILSNNEGVVFYRIKTISGEPILMRVNYFLSEKSIANISFYLAEQKPDGQYKYEILSQEGERMAVEFLMKNGTLNNVRLDTSFRPLPEKRQLDTVLTLLSLEKKEIKITFSWNADGSIKNVNVKPAVIDQDIQKLQSFKNLPPEKREQMEKMLASLPALIIKIVKIVFYGASLLFYILTVFFFTRPKVKEQFK